MSVSADRENLNSIMDENDGYLNFTYDKTHSHPTSSGCQAQVSPVNY